MQTECLSAILVGMLVIMPCLVGFFFPSTEEPFMKLHLKVQIKAQARYTCQYFTYKPTQQKVMHLWI